LGSLKLSSKVGSVREREAEVSSQECCEDKLLGLKYQRNNSTFIYTLIHSPCLVKLMFKGGRDNTNPLSPPDSPVTGTVLIPILWTEKLRPTVVGRKWESQNENPCSLAESGHNLCTQCHPKDKGMAEENKNQAECALVMGYTLG
jgi:hypothetical protein